MTIMGHLKIYNNYHKLFRSLVVFQENGELARTLEAKGKKTPDASIFHLILPPGRNPYGKQIMVRCISKLSKAGHQGLIHRKTEGNYKFESKKRSTRPGQVFYKDDWRRHGERFP